MLETINSPLPAKLTINHLPEGKCGTVDSLVLEGTRQSVPVAELSEFQSAQGDTVSIDRT